MAQGNVTTEEVSQAKDLLMPEKPAPNHVEVPPEVMRPSNPDTGYLNKAQNANEVLKEMNQAGEQLTSQYSQLQAQLNSPEYQQLRQQDPGRAALIGQELSGQMQNIQQQGIQLSQAMSNQQYELNDALAANKQALEDAIPSWIDPKVKKKEKRQIREYLRKNGYSESDINNINDPRTLIMARDSALGSDKNPRYGQMKKLKSSSADIEKRARAAAIKAGKKGKYIELAAIKALIDAGA